MAKVAATPITRWKWPVTNSLLAALVASSWLARNKPESPPDRNSETKPIANSIAVASRTSASHSVPSQLASKTEAGIPSDAASCANTSGEYGSRALENMWNPQTQNPTTPTPHNASTAARSAHTGRRENVAIRCETIPKHDSTATYTCACAKNQNHRCHRGVSDMPELTCSAKNRVPKNQSAIKRAHAASKIAKISRLSTAVTYQAHTVSGKRVRVMPSARSTVTVVEKFTADRIAAKQKQITLTSHTSIPVRTGNRLEAAIPPSDPSVSQNDRPLSSGSAISFAPICSGRKKYPNPNCGAEVSTKSTISDPCSNVSPA